jgi:Protein of unknown function (DUF2894)
MSEAKPEPSSPDSTTLALLVSLRAAGAARLDAVGWHYIETLAKRSDAHTGPAQALLNDKLLHALTQFKARLDASLKPSDMSRDNPSPLAALLNDMARHVPALPGSAAPSQGMALKTLAWRAENPKVQQFKKQLGKISVQRQVTQAIAQAPQNAGPINSHMLALRSLGLMRDASQDYLNRFMTYVDTLLCLDEAAHQKLPTKKPAQAVKTKVSAKPSLQQD